MKLRHIVPIFMLALVGAPGICAKNAQKKGPFLAFSISCESSSGRFILLYIAKPLLEPQPLFGNVFSAYG